MILGRLFQPLGRWMLKARRSARGLAATAAGLAWGLIPCGMGRVLTPQDALPLARLHHDAGVDFTTLHVGTGFESDDEMARLAGAVLEAAAITGHRLHVAVAPGRKPEVHFVQVRQLLAGLVDLPVIGVAAGHHDVVGAVFDHDPGAHRREVHEVRREGVQERLIAFATVLGVLRLQDVAWAGAEDARASQASLREEN